MFRKFLAISAFLVLGFSASAQEYTSIEIDKWTDGTGFTSSTAPWMLAGTADTTELIELNDYLSSNPADTNITIVVSTSADTAQLAYQILFFSNNKLLGTSSADSLVYGFNTDKIYPAKAMNIFNIKPAGTTAIKVRYTESTTYNKDGNEGRLNIGVINR